MNRDGVPDRIKKLVSCDKIIDEIATCRECDENEITLKLNKLESWLWSFYSTGRKEEKLGIK